MRARARTRPRRVLLARDHRLRRSVASTAPMLGTVRDVYRIGENEVFVVEGGPVGAVRPARGPGVHPRLRAASRRDRRGCRVARPAPGRRARTPDPERPKAPRRDVGARPKPATPHRDGGAAAGGRAMTLEIDVLTLFPAMLDGPLSGQHPGPHPGAGPGRDPDPRPARVGARPPSVGRRRAVRRRRRDGPAPGARRRRPRRAPPTGLDWRSCSTRAARSSARPAPPTWRRDPHLIFVCARYEGVDERIRSLVDLELSIGDYVLTGGELPALVVIDAVLRLLPGAIDAASTEEESFSAGLLEYPQYTRPPTFRGHGRAGHPLVGRSRRGPALARGRRHWPGPGNAGPTSSTEPTGAD